MFVVQSTHQRKTENDFGTMVAIFHASVRQNEQFSDSAYDRHSEPVPDIESGLRLHTNDLVSHRWDEELIRLVNVPMLSERRLHLKLVEVYKILHGLWDFPGDILQIQLAHSSRLARAQTLHCPFAWTIIITHLSPVASELGTH